MSLLERRFEHHLQSFCIPWVWPKKKKKYKINMFYQLRFLEVWFTPYLYLTKEERESQVSWGLTRVK